MLDKNSSKNLTNCVIREPEFMPQVLSVMSKLNIKIDGELYDKFISAVMTSRDFTSSSAANLLLIISDRNNKDMDIRVILKILGSFPNSYNVQMSCAILLASRFQRMKQDDKKLLDELVMNKLSRPDLFVYVYGEKKLIQMASDSTTDNAYKLSLLSDELTLKRKSEIIDVLPSMNGNMGNYTDEILSFIDGASERQLRNISCVLGEIYNTEASRLKAADVLKSLSVMRHSQAYRATLKAVIHMDEADDPCVVGQELVSIIGERSSSSNGLLKIFEDNLNIFQARRIFSKQGVASHLIDYAKEGEYEEKRNALRLLSKVGIDHSSRDINSLMGIFVSSYEEEIKSLVVKCLSHCVSSKEYVAKAISRIAFSATPTLFDSCLHSLKNLSQHGIDTHNIVCEYILYHEFSNSRFFAENVVDLMDKERSQEIADRLVQRIYGGDDEQVEFCASILARIAPGRCSELFYAINKDKQTAFLTGVSRIKNIPQELEYFGVHIMSKYKDVRILANTEKLSGMTAITLFDVMATYDVNSEEWDKCVEVYSQHKHSNLLSFLRRIPEMQGLVLYRYLRGLNNTLKGEYE